MRQGLFLGFEFLVELEVSMNLLEKPLSAVADGEFACPLLPADHALDFLSREGEDSGFFGGSGVFLCHVFNLSQTGRSARIIFDFFEFFFWMCKQSPCQALCRQTACQAGSIAYLMPTFWSCNSLNRKALRARRAPKSLIVNNLR